MLSAARADAALRGASPGACVGHAVARAEAGAFAAGLTHPLAIPDGEIAMTQPYWVARTYLESRAGHPQDGRAALQRALGLTANPRLRGHLQAAAPTATAA